jgi:hypothetical protein
MSACGHLADISIAANVRFAPGAVIREPRANATGEIASAKRVAAVPGIMQA